MAKNKFGMSDDFESVCSVGDCDELCDDAGNEEETRPGYYYSKHLGNVLTVQKDESNQSTLKKIRSSIAHIKHWNASKDDAKYNSIIEDYVRTQLSWVKEQKIATDMEIELCRDIIGYPTDVLMFMAEIPDAKVRKRVWKKICNENTYPSTEKAKAVLAELLNKEKAK